MASIKLLLGMIPSTTKIEQEEKALIAEFEKLQAYTESAQLARYNELNELVSSSDFLQKKKEIESLRFKNSEEYSREREFLSMKKAKDIVMYFRTLEGSMLKKFQELDGSEKIKKYEELRDLVKGSGFKEKMKSKEFAGSDDAAKLAEFKQMDSSSEISDYFKFKDSKEYANFVNIDGSSRLARYYELKEYTSSKEFTDSKEYLLDRKRFEKTDMYKEIQEFEGLRKDPDIVWYFKVKDSKKFDILKARELTFGDEFDGENLDTKVWLTNYFYGDKLLKDQYSIDPDLQYYTKSANFEVRNSNLKIITKPEKIKGKAWTPGGFVIRDFEYTSGIINTGRSFSQKYGIFTAKIKLGDANAKSALWLLADKITPHIDICRTGNGKVWCDMFTGNGNHVKTKVGAKYAGDFYIYTLEWTADKLVWKINGVEAFSQTSNVPQEPMYINLAGGLEKPISSPTSVEVDWIRVYKTV